MFLDDPRKGYSRKESGVFETPAKTTQKTRDNVESVVSYVVSGGASAFTENILRQKGFDEVESVELENGAHLISARATREDIENVLKSMRGATYVHYDESSSQVA